MKAADSRRRRGFTTIELMVVVAIIVILVTLAGPSFIDLFARKRLEGVAQELSTDIQYSRSESVARNVPLSITFVDSTCYVIHESSLTVSNCDASSDPRQLKVVAFARDVSAAYSATPTSVTFEPLRGSANAFSITLSSARGSWQMKASISTLGRVELCAVSASVVGFRPCA